MFSSRPQVPAFSHTYRSPIQYPSLSHHSLSPYRQYSNSMPMYDTAPLYPSSVPAPPQRGQPPRCLPILPKKNANVLSSSAIDKMKLSAPAQIISKYSKLCIESKASTLATKLAHEGFFGDQVLGLCTVMGYREQPGLPSQELNELKQALFEHFPQFWSSPVEFEPLWALCADSIGQTCKRLRQK